MINRPARPWGRTQPAAADTAQNVQAHLDGGGHLLLADLLVLLLFGSSLKALPRQGAPQEVHDHVAQRLNVVPPALLDAQVRVDAGIPRRPRQVLVLSAETCTTLSTLDISSWKK